MQRPDLRELRHVPAAAKSLDQEGAGIHLAAQDVDPVSLVLECDGFCCHDLQVGVGASFVEIR